MGALPVAIGQEAAFTKTVSESDVYLFAGITGDLAPNHVDETYMAGTAFGRRIAHGALLVGFMSTASTRLIEQAGGVDSAAVPVSLGYDRIRFIAPVHLGDTITVRYRVAALDPARNRSTAEIEVTNQAGRTVAVARHILAWVPSPAAR